MLEFSLISSFLLIHPTPSNDGNSSLIHFILRRHLQYPVSPDDVDVPGEHVGGPVGGGHGHDGLGGRVLECSLSLQTKTDRHRQIGLLGFVFFDGGSVVVEWFPLRAVSIPVESGGGNVHLEVISDLVQHHVEGGTVFGPLHPVIGDQVGVSVP